MNKLGVSAEPIQEHTLPVPGYADSAILTLEYRPDQYAWFFSVTWGEWGINNVRLTTDPNILRQYSRVLPFGFAVLSSDGADPLFVDSFSTVVCEMYMIDAADIDVLGVYGG